MIPPRQGSSTLRPAPLVGWILDHLVACDAAFPGTLRRFLLASPLRRQCLCLGLSELELDAPSRLAKRLRHADHEVLGYADPLASSPTFCCTAVFEMSSDCSTRMPLGWWVLSANLLQCRSPGGTTALSLHSIPSQSTDTGWLYCDTSRTFPDRRSQSSWRFLPRISVFQCSNA